MRGSWRLIFVLTLLSGCDSAPARKPVKPAKSESAESPRIQNVNWESAGDQAAAANNPSRAVACYQKAIELSDPPTRELLDKLGQQWMNVGRPFESVEVLRRAIDLYPTDVDLRTKMVSAQSSLGLQREAAEHLQWLIQRGYGNLNLLIIAADLSRPQTIESTCQYALKHYPEDLRPQFSIASVRAAYGQWDEVAELLQPVVKRHPDFAPAGAYYLRALVELQRRTDVHELLPLLPTNIQSHLQYWLAAGSWADQNGDLERAAKAYWRAIQLSENDGESMTRFASALRALDRRDESQVASLRAADITSLRDSIDALRTWNNDSQATVIKIALTLRRLGRLWEATTWLQVGFQMQQNPDPQIRDVYQQTRAELTGKTPWQSPNALVANRVDLSELPTVEWKSKASSSVAAESSIESLIRLHDVAAENALTHICEINTSTGQESGLTIFQSGAGGVGVIDFDLDGWQDLYLTMIDGTPKEMNSSPNRLFRNLDGHFSGVTKSADVGDRGFAQGITVGDYDSDGWPDLLVANVGPNRLYRNNGDGTFSDVTGASGLSGDDWTTSAAIVDIDGDTHADIVEVGYCGGDFVYEHLCIDREVNAPRSCSPLAFEAQPDRVWRGLGDGSFARADGWLGPHEAGRGFGLIAGQLDDSPGIDLYIANDMTANHYWTRSPSREGSFQLSQQATVRGLAVNERSLSQASMGIAAADADGDGDIDFLLTHFFDDHNTFYEQVSGGIWMDRSRGVDLAHPSQAMLGYGTQWIDFDNDGLHELFVANGDIDDFSYKGRRFRQPAQVFRRHPEGNYRLQPPESLGEYFTQDHLGRAVVTLDANRDGLNDVLVTHLFEPVSLLENRTGDAGESIRFFLCSTRSQRDAIGCRVTVEIGDQSHTGFLLAGNGYQCSCERSILFGTGIAKQVDRVTVEWPDGDRSLFNAISTGDDYLIVQGDADAFKLPRR